MLPMPIANHIAQALELPGLFLGTYGEAMIEYIHLIEYFRDCGGIVEICVILKCNQSLYGMTIDRDEGDCSALVRLDENDPIVDLLHQYSAFPDAPNDWDDDVLTVQLLVTEGMIEHSIHNPQLSSFPTTDLFAAHIEMLRRITKSSQKPDAVIVPALHQMTPIEKTADFADRYRHLHLFGQSGLSGQLDAPHDTDYILEVIIKRKTTAIFVKTAHYFRGVTYPYQKMTDVVDASIIDIPEPAVNWKQLFNDAQPFARDYRGGTLIEMRLLLKNSDIRAHFRLKKTTAPPELWYIFQALIAQFPES